MLQKELLYERKLQRWFRKIDTPTTARFEIRHLKYISLMDLLAQERMHPFPVHLLKRSNQNNQKLQHLEYRVLLQIRKQEMQERKNSRQLKNREKINLRFPYWEIFLIQQKKSQEDVNKENDIKEKRRKELAEIEEARCVSYLISVLHV